jgi:hypothetical protein
LTENCGAKILRVGLDGLDDFFGALLFKLLCTPLAKNHRQQKFGIRRQIGKHVQNGNCGTGKAGQSHRISAREIEIFCERSVANSIFLGNSETKL